MKEKRKRSDENGERPKKKPSVEPSGNVQVELIENKDLLGPYLGMLLLLSREKHN